VLEIETLLEYLCQREQYPLDQIPALAEGSRQKREHADGKHAGSRLVTYDGQIDDHRVCGVISERPHDREQGGDDAPADRQRLVCLVELLRKPVVAAYQEIREPEELELLG